MRGGPFISSRTRWKQTGKSGRRGNTRKRSVVGRGGLTSHAGVGKVEGGETIKNWRGAQIAGHAPEVYGKFCPM